MKILLTGGTGLIGKRWIRRLLEADHEVSVISRSVDGARKRLGTRVRLFRHVDDISNFERFDVIVNLAGESIAEGRWTEERKRSILESRVRVTRQCIRLMERLEEKPQVFLSASAVGYYGYGETPQTESDPAGSGFLADVGQAWENEAVKAEALGVRTCRMRIGIVLAREGGAYPKMLPPFQFKVAARLGNGRQWMSWIHIEDVLSAMDWLISKNKLSGPFNFVVPEPVTNREFTRIMGKVKGALIWTTTPAPILRALLGEMADHLLLQGQHVVPRALRDSGFTFAYPDLEKALRQLDGEST